MIDFDSYTIEITCPNCGHSTDRVFKHGTIADRDRSPCLYCGVTIRQYEKGRNKIEYLKTHELGDIVKDW
ncbi:hypothetical protein M1146_05995 [Patescibacteria group bacterium]|nr:hypothetical protein [Patescibacteria group bacterium]